MITSKSMTKNQVTKWLMNFNFSNVKARVDIIADMETAVFSHSVHVRNAGAGRYYVRISA